VVFGILERTVSNNFIAMFSRSRAVEKFGDLSEVCARFTGFGGFHRFSRPLVLVCLVESL
jgi:hypothetical protein